MSSFVHVITLTILLFGQNAFSLSNLEEDPLYLTPAETEYRDLSAYTEVELMNLLKEQTEYVSRYTEHFFLEESPIEERMAFSTGNTLGGIISSANTIGRFIRVGKMLWQIVKKGKPVTNLDFEALSVVPNEVTNWFQMSNWSMPNSNVYQMIYKNGYGAEVVNFTYRLQYTYGGKYDGKGQYLSNIKVSPVHIKVLWGYRLDASAETLNIQNTGSIEEPVPAVELLVKHRVKTILVEHNKSDSFYIRGDGYMQKIGEQY